jgi:hypothetical protein
VYNGVNFSDGEIKFTGDLAEDEINLCVGEYEVVENGVIKISWDIDKTAAKKYYEDESLEEDYDEFLDECKESASELDDMLGGKFDYEITDKKNSEIYIEDFSEALSQLLIDGKQSNVNYEANSICNAINSALTEMDEEGYYIDTMIYTSREESNVIDSSVDLEKFAEKVESYCSDINDYEYVALVKNGTCTAVWCADDWDTTVVGTYPESESTGKSLNDLFKKD